MAGRTDVVELNTRFQEVARLLDSDGVVPWSFTPSLGIAWRRPAGPGVSRFLYQELRSRVVRRIAVLSRMPVVGGRALGNAAENLLGAVRMEGPSLGGPDCVLILGRTRSKLLDFENLTATAIDAPEQSAIPQEVLAREGCGRVTTTDLLEVRQRDGVFVERLEAGYNLAIRGAGRHLTNQVNDLLDRWRSDRVREVVARDYVVRIESEIGERSRTEDWRQIRGRLPLDGVLQLELSHGDLQPSNLLATPNGLLLVDFEHLDWRAAGYDRATYARSLRWANVDLNQLEPWIAAEEFRYRVRSGRKHGRSSSEQSDEQDSAVDARTKFVGETGFLLHE